MLPPLDIVVLVAVPLTTSPTTCTPPLNIVVLVAVLTPAVPPTPTNCVPPFEIVVSVAVPLYGSSNPLLPAAEDRGAGRRRRPGE